MTIDWNKAFYPEFRDALANESDVVWGRAVLSASDVSGDKVTGSFAGAATVTVGVPPDLAARCARHGGIRTIAVTGTITLGSNSLPVALYHLGGPGSRATGTSPTYDPTYRPFTIVDGPEGALWFADRGGTTPNSGSIGRITTSGSTTIYSHTGMNPQNLTVGPDGALWFTNASDETASACPGNSYSIGRMTTTGVVSYFADSRLGNISPLTVGPDGALWFTSIGCEGVPSTIGRITTAGAMTIYNDPGTGPPEGLVVGPDGALWFENNGSVGRITTSGTITLFAVPGGGPAGLTVGPDGALWFAGGSGIDRVATSGTLTSFTNPDIYGLQLLRAGPDGALWFYGADFYCTKTLGCGGTSTLGRITTSGAVTAFAPPGGFGSGPVAVIDGPEDSLWFADYGPMTQASITKASTSGAITTYRATNSAGIGIVTPDDLVVGPDGNVWFVDVQNDVIGRISIP